MIQDRGKAAQMPNRGGNKQRGSHVGTPEEDGAGGQCTGGRIGTGQQLSLGTIERRLSGDKG